MKELFEKFQFYAAVFINKLTTCHNEYMKNWRQQNWKRLLIFNNTRATIGVKMFFEP
jgi:hypothetical protein